MKRFRRSGLVTLSSFAAVLLAIEAASRMIAPSLPVDPGKWPRIEIASKLSQMHDLAVERRRVDVLFAGSSMMAGGIDAIEFTRKSGTPAYNAAFAGPSTRTVTPWVLDIVEPLLSPEVVVLGLQTRELNDNAPKNATMFEAFASSPGYKQAKGSVTSRLEGEIEEVSYFMRYRRALRDPSQFFEQDTDDEEALAEADLRQVIGPRGTRLEEPRTYRRSEVQIQQLHDRTLVDFELGGVEYRSLERLATELEDRGVTLVLMNMPVASDYWDAHDDPTGERRAYREMVTAFAKEHDVTLIDAEQAFPSNAPFRDIMHVDIEGRQALAHALAEDWDEVTSGSDGIFDMECSANVIPKCELSSSGDAA